MADFPDRRFDWRRLALVALLAFAAWAAGERYACSATDLASGQTYSYHTCAVASNSKFCGKRNVTPALSVKAP